MKRIIIFIGYLWRVLAGLLEVAIVLYVFSRLNTPFEFIVVSILGLMYGSLRTIGIGLWQMLAQLGGPRIYSYEELLRTIGRSANVKPILVPVPFAAWHGLAWIAEMLPAAPLQRDGETRS